MNPLRVYIDAPEPESLASEIEPVKQRVAIMLIVDADSYRDAASELKAIKAKAKQLEDQRKSLTAPTDELKKRIMDLFRGPLDMLAQAESSIKRSMIAYDQEQERIRREEEARIREAQRKEQERLRKLAEENARKAAEARESGNEAKAVQYEARAEEQITRAETTPTAVVLADARPKVAGISTIEIWHARVTDPAQIPREYMIPNLDMLGRIAKNTKGTIAIPGVEFYAEKTMRAGR